MMRRDVKAIAAVVIAALGLGLVPSLSLADGISVGVSSSPAGVGASGPFTPPAPPAPPPLPAFTIPSGVVVPASPSSPTFTSSSSPISVGRTSGGTGGTFVGFQDPSFTFTLNVQRSGLFFDFDSWELGVP